MGVKEEETGNVVPGPAIMGEVWWSIEVDDVPFCCLLASSWFEARAVGRGWAERENIVVEQVRK
jgi:hypothetical protein